LTPVLPKSRVTNQLNLSQPNECVVYLELQCLVERAHTFARVGD
jgi:hypothetical protein